MRTTETGKNAANALRAQVGLKPRRDCGAPHLNAVIKSKYGIDLIELKECLGDDWGDYREHPEKLILWAEVISNDILGIFNLGIFNKA